MSGVESAIRVFRATRQRDALTAPLVNDIANLSALVSSLSCLMPPQVRLEAFRWVSKFLLGWWPRNCKSKHAAAVMDTWISFSVQQFRTAPWASQLLAPVKADITTIHKFRTAVMNVCTLLSTDVDQQFQCFATQTLCTHLHFWVAVNTSHPFRHEALMFLSKSSPSLVKFLRDRACCEVLG